jgi:stage II sporulation protein D
VGDRVVYVEREGRVVYLEAEQTRRGAAADRGSRYYNWEVRLAPDDVSRSLARYGSVGRVLDLVPKRLGVSGRVVELGVVGSEGQLDLKGLQVRWGLGLRENLFVVNREKGSRGEVERFVITGKGWGHGVGLCQVGAYGMAQAGSTFEQILKHYYTGIRLSHDPRFARVDLGPSS